MNELDRRILTKACGLCWHEPEDILDEHNMPCVKCKVCGEVVYYLHFTDRPYCHENHTFTTADDWELVRQKVVVPNQEAFCEHLDKHGVWPIIWFSLSSEDRNKIAADFIKAQPNRFPWVVEMEEVNV